MTKNQPYRVRSTKTGRAAVRWAAKKSGGFESSRQRRSRRGPAVCRQIAGIVVRKGDHCSLHASSRSHGAAISRPDRSYGGLDTPFGGNGPAIIRASSGRLGPTGITHPHGRLDHSPMLVIPVRRAESCDTKSLFCDIHLCRRKDRSKSGRFSSVRAGRLRVFDGVLGRFHRHWRRASCVPAV